jgi:hypothetical protein
MRLASSLSLAAALAVTIVVTGSPIPHPTAEAASRWTLDRRIHATAVTESSGLARSTYARGVLWTHNDSGGLPRIYAIKPDGSTAAVVTLRGATARDWEDIASGPGHTLWVGDIGDNLSRRPYVTVYRLTEPAALASTTVKVRRFDLSYPDGPHNAEALLVHPTSGRVSVVTKSPFGGAVYSAPKTLSSTSRNRLTKVATAPLKVTAGSYSPDGSRIVLCNYSRAFVYRRFGGTPQLLVPPPRGQGESLEVDRAGTAAFMGSEGRNSPIYRVTLPRR